MSVVDAIRAATAQLEESAKNVAVEARSREIGCVLATGDGIARVSGLPGARSLELLSFQHDVSGIAFNVDENEIGTVILGDDSTVSAGDLVSCTGQVVRTPVGKALLGRVVDPLGTPLDDGPAIVAERYDPVEREAPPILSRAPVVRPLATGIKSIDAMIPIGRGQRELIIGDRSTGKTTIAIDAMINQVESGVICVYVAIGQRASAVARFIEALRERGAMDHSVVVVADADSSPGMKFIAPYSGCAISEYFMEQGDDTLIVYDDLTKHAQTYREISLLLRRPPGREAFPGDIFFIHSRLLERATQFDEEHGGGSQTALPIIETQAQNISAYVPTNLISITDGQVYLSPELFQTGFLPAVDVGLSVSRVGGKTQIPAMKKQAQKLRLAYTQFLELEQFTKFGTTMEEDTRATLEHGKRLRAMLKQPEHLPITLAEQVLLLVLASGDFLSSISVDDVYLFETEFLAMAREQLGDLLTRLREGGDVEDADVTAIEAVANKVKEKMPKAEAETSTPLLRQGSGGQTNAQEGEGDTDDAGAA